MIRRCRGTKLIKLGAKAGPQSKFVSPSTAKDSGSNAKGICESLRITVGEADCPLHKASQPSVEVNARKQMRLVSTHITRCYAVTLSKVVDWMQPLPQETQP